MYDLTSWLDNEVYPALSHPVVFGDLGKFHKKGNSWWACCPVHSEETPSFHMQAGKPFGHCFGCGETISWFRAVEMRVGTGRAAVEEIAKMAGVEPLAIAKTNPEVQKIREWWESAKETVWESPTILEYLRQKRAYSDEMIRQMDIGCIPEGPVPPGIKLPSGENHPLLLPVYNPTGRLLFCIGRAVDPSISPKYMYPRGASISHFLAGLRRHDVSKPVVVVEGVMDALVLNSCGIQAGAIGSASVSTKQAEHLRRFPEVVLALDADEAGQKGTERAIRTLRNNIYVVSDMGGKKDPDELIRDHGIDVFREKMAQAEAGPTWYVSWLANGYATMSDREKDAVLGRATQYIEGISSRIVAEQCIVRLRDVTDLSIDALGAEAQRIRVQRQEEKKKAEIERKLEQAQKNLREGKDVSEIATEVARIATAKFVLPTPVEYDHAIQQFLNRPDGISFPWRELDHLGRMLPGTITTLIGGTSHGKTSVATALALHCLSEGKRVVYWSGEIPADFIAMKMTAYLAGFPLSDMVREQAAFFRGDPLRAETIYARQVMQEISKNLFIPEAKDFVEVEKLISYCEQAEVNVLIVDYIQQLRTGSVGEKYRTRDEELEAVLQELNFYISGSQKYAVCLGQMNREAKNREKPEIVYARHSATIEHYSSIVLGIWNSGMVKIDDEKERSAIPEDGWYWKDDQKATTRAAMYALEQKKHLLEISILKNRYFGNVNKAVPLFFEGASGVIRDFPESAWTSVSVPVKL